MPVTKRKRAKLLREAMLKTTINGLEKLSALEQGKLALLIMKVIENAQHR